MENDELQNALKNVGSAAVVLGPGAKSNDFIGFNASGYEKSVVTLSDGDKGPEGNRFIGGEFKRFQPEIPIQEQVDAASYVSQEKRSEPLYKQLYVQVAGGLILAAVIALLIWLGVPLKA